MGDDRREDKGRVKRKGGVGGCKVSYQDGVKVQGGEGGIEESQRKLSWCEGVSPLASRALRVSRDFE